MLVPNWTQGGTEVPQFCPGTFLHLQIPITGEGQETLAFRSILPKLTWQRHYHGGWNDKTLPRVGVCPSVHLGASLKVLRHDG